MPFKGENNHHRPGIELFFWRIVILFFFLLISGLVFRETPLWYGLSFISFMFILLLFIAYHLYILQYFKTLQYEITEKSIKITTLLFKKEILLNDIKCIEDRTSTPINVEKKTILSYLKETPQLIHPVGQFGGIILEGIGKVYFYSTIDTFKKPTNLILITTRSIKRYGISPEDSKDFIDQIKLKSDLGGIEIPMGK